MQGNPSVPNKIYGFSPEFKIENNKNILLNLAVRFGEEYREQQFPYGLYNYIEKWNRTRGCAQDGIYFYNFCINTDRVNYQPSGAQSVNKWKYVSFEFKTIVPPLSKTGSDIDIVCDDDKNIVAIRKNPFTLNKYNFDVKVYEERYNLLIVTGGRLGLQNAR